MGLARTAVEEPLFLFGAERSGTTLLRLMLDHHPQISLPHQLEFVVDSVGDDGRLPDLASFWAELEEDPVFQRSGFRIDRTLDYIELVNDFLHQRHGNRSIVGGSVHRHLERLLHLWPHARMIHIVRDPRAVARSVMAMGWAANPWSAVSSWVAVEESWNRLGGRLPASRRHELRYEDLVVDPRRELERICAFLGLAFDEAMLSYPEDSTYDPPNASSLDQWCSQLSSKEQHQVEARVGGLLRERGYPPSTSGAISIGPLRRAWLRLEDRLGRARFRRRRYGWKLYVQGAVARRMGATAWRRRVGARLRAIDAQYIK